MMIIGILLALAGAQPAAALEPELIDIAILPLSGPHRVYVTDSYGTGRTRIVDGETARMIGLIHHPPLTQFAVDPSGRYLLVAESLWARSNRGKRQDLLSVYDSRTLNVVAEIPLPGRIIVGDKPQALSVTPDGRYALVYDMDPANSVHIVDLTTLKLVGNVETPGCALVFPMGGRDFGTLCAEGAVASIRYSGGKPVQTRADAVFDAEADPIIDQADLALDGTGFMVAYSGLIYPVDMKAAQPLGTPFSLQVAAGLPAASMVPGDLAWRPGGRQVSALHRLTGQLFVLMHAGEIWGQNTPGQELWTLDTRTRKVTRRLRLQHGAVSVAVSQDSNPLLYLNGDGVLRIFDMASGEPLRQIGNIGTGPISVAPQ